MIGDRFPDTQFRWAFRTEMPQWLLSAHLPYVWHYLCPKCVFSVRTTTVFNWCEVSPCQHADSPVVRLYCYVTECCTYLFSVFECVFVFMLLLTVYVLDRSCCRWFPCRQAIGSVGLWHRQFFTCISCQCEHFVVDAKLNTLLVVTHFWLLTLESINTCFFH